MSIELAGKLPGPVAFVLAGGASYGAVQVGQIRALAKTDLSPDMVVGTSVGALNGTIVAEDPESAPDRLAALWSSVVREDVFGKTLPTAYRLASRQGSAIDNKALQSFIERATSARNFTDLKVPHTAVATDFDTGEAVAIREGELISAVLASAAIPAVFPVIERDGRRLVDGGVVANVPISVAAAQGAQTIVVLDCGFTVVAPQKESTMRSSLVRMAAIMASQQVRRDLEKVRDRTVLYLPGPWPIRTRPDDFRKSQSLAGDAFELSMEWLAGLRIEGTGRYGKAPSDFLARKG